VITFIERSEEEFPLDEVVTKLLNTEARVVRKETAEAHVAAPPRVHGRQPEIQTCYHCGKRGHISRNCHARARAAPQGSQAKALKSGLAAPSSTAWLVNLGASHHVCSDRNMLTNMRKSNVKSMITANHGAVVVKGQGDVRLRLCAWSEKNRECM
jgi:hypothetical protein